MEAKSWKGWIVAGVLALCSLIAAPVVDSLVKEGKFPDGLGAVLSTLWGWLSGLFTAQVSIPLWLALLAFLPIAVSLRGLIMIKKQALELRKPSPIIEKLEKEIQAFSRHNTVLTTNNAQLEYEFAAISGAHHDQQNRNAALERERSALEKKCHDLQQQLAAMSQAPEEVEAEVEIPAFAIKTLNNIVNLTNRGFKPNMVFLNTSGGSRVEVEGAIDILLERKMLQYTDTAGTTSYKLTPKGRAYYLEQKSKDEG